MTLTQPRSSPWNQARTEFSLSAKGGPAALSCAALRFDPQAWRYGNVLKRFPSLAQTRQNRYKSLESWYDDKSNCYAYALGDLTLFLARVGASPYPGVIAGQSFYQWSLKPDHVIDAVIGDGLKPTWDKLVLAKNIRPVALFMAEREDYHWLRLDRTGAGADMMWTHKFRKKSPAVVTDANGKTVRDVRKLALPRGEKTPYRFISFFSVPTKLSMRADIFEHYRENGNPQILRHEDYARQRDGEIPIGQLA